MIKTLLWDFGDTLVDERWMQAAPEGCETWPDAYRDLLYETPLGDQWMLGRIDTRAVAMLLSERIRMEVQDVVDHMQQASRSIAFFNGILNYARSCPIPQAIVTLNPDLFSDVVVPHFGLGATFPVIVTSWEEHTLSKTALCDIALERQALGIDRCDALLIDNKVSNVDEWRSAGGASYWFTNEADFLANPPLLPR